MLAFYLDLDHSVVQTITALHRHHIAANTGINKLAIDRKSGNQGASSMNKTKSSSKCRLLASLIVLALFAANLDHIQ
jgi:hypothetical protein